MMKGYADSPTQYRIDNMAPDTGRPRVIIGVWVFHGPELYRGVYQDKVGRHMRDGTFLASREPTSLGYSWRMKLLEKSPLEELSDDLVEGLLYRYGPAQSETFSGVSSAGPHTHEVITYEHRDLMTALKEELEARFGQVAEMNVLFQEMRTLPFGWQRQFRVPWWRRILEQIPAGHRLNRELELGDAR